ncbi:MAG TPA: prepilin-type N-terminal cleavage/methylation domain-containing protein [Terrimicrobiaceae bacterium]
MIFRAGTNQSAGWQRARGGFSMIEIVVALSVGLLLAAVAVPSAGSWLNERRLREEAGRLREAVESARFTAMSSGVPQEVLIASPQEAKEKKKRLPGETHLFIEETPFQWSVTPSRSGTRRIRISGRGFVDPVELKVESAGTWLAFRFELLTGLPRDERSSF